MYDVTFAVQSNQASWIFIGMVTDLSDQPIDISACSMVFAVRAKRSGPNKMLVASTANGKITYPSLGTFRWFFTEGEMNGLRAGTYDTGLTLTNDDGTQTVQLSVGSLPIVDGVVP
jgi:hypothetical protein